MLIVRRHVSILHDPRGWSSSAGRLLRQTLTLATFPFADRCVPEVRLLRQILLASDHGKQVEFGQAMQSSEADPWIFPLYPTFLR